ncbi:MAG: hypothetical protein GXP46_03980, partial [Deferribacteres bacterium]|nr:hypothetical protein [Deferribacteres bacterium]
SRFAFENALREAAGYLKTLKQFAESDPHFILEEAALKELENLHLELVLQGYAHSLIGRNYTHIAAYDLQDKLLKLSALQAAIHQRENITREDVRAAFVDMVELWGHTLHYIEAKVMGRLDYGSGWNGAAGKAQECLRWLFQQGASSRENSKVSISEFVAQIEKVYGVANETARKRLYRFQENGWIEAAQLGQHDSRVWLAFEPEEKSADGMDAIREKLSNSSTYLSIAKKFEGGQGVQGGIQFQTKPQKERKNIALRENPTKKGDKYDKNTSIIITQNSEFYKDIHPGHPPSPFSVGFKDFDPENEKSREHDTTLPPCPPSPPSTGEVRVKGSKGSETQLTQNTLTEEPPLAEQILQYLRESRGGENYTEAIREGCGFVALPVLETTLEYMAKEGDLLQPEPGLWKLADAPPQADEPEGEADALLISRQREALAFLKGRPKGLATTLTDLARAVSCPPEDVLPLVEQLAPEGVIYDPKAGLVAYAGDGTAPPLIERVVDMGATNPKKSKGVDKR